MTFDDEEILQNYIGRLLALQDDRKEWLGEDDLKRVAHDLGLSDEDVARLEAVTEAHRQRGKNFGRHGAWDEAISEFRQATVLDPFDVPLLYELAVAHASRFEESQDDEDREATQRYAHRCIELDPNHHASFELLAALKPKPRQAPQPPRARLIVAGAVVLLVGIGGAVFSILALEEPPPPAPVVERPTLPPSSTLPPSTPSEAQIPIHLDDGEMQGLRLEVQRSLFKPYDDSFSYTLHATLFNEGEELHRLRLKMTLLDAEGTILHTKYFDGLGDHEPYLRPGDTAPLSTLIYEKQPPPGLQNVYLAVDIIEREPAATSYGVAQDIPFSWEFEQPEHIDVTLSERENRVVDSLREPLHFLTFAVKNEGTRSVHHLRLKVTWFDAQENVLTSELTYAVPSSGPALRSGETWVVRAIGTLPAGRTPPFARYAVSVAEAQ